MSQLSRIAKHLRRNNTGAGITPSRLAKLAKVPVDAVYRNVAKLRLNEGKSIYKNFRNVKGKRTMFYRIAS